jgi:hypothetical protein
MSIAPALQRYLTAENIQYDVVPYDVRAYRRGMSDFGELFGQGNRAAARCWLHARRPASVASSRISDLRN